MNSNPDASAGPILAPDNPTQDTPRMSLWDGTLTPDECIWRDHYDFLKSHGYTLRPRYRPDWSPSWLNTSKGWRHSEDGVTNELGRVLDAVRPDGSVVALKQVDQEFPDEIPMGKMFSAEPFSTNPRNHCVPVLDVIEPMEGFKWKFIVMPLLMRTNVVPFKTVGEVVDFFSQIFEGLQFMHENNITHGDCKYNNIMVDASCLYESPPHPFRPRMKRDFSSPVDKPMARTKKPVKYYFIDFDLAKVYKPEDAPHLEKPPWGGDKTVPEHSIPGYPPCDPFPVDVYCIGNAIRQYFLGGLPRRPAKKGFEFMQELITDMVQEDPTKRPTMTSVVSRFDQIVKGLSSWKLRSPVIAVDERWGIFHSIAHWTRQSYYITLRLPPIPRFQAKNHN